MSLLCEALRYLSVACLGVFAGAMLTEGGVLVPYWRSLPPVEFLRWYAANAERLLGFFGPLTSVTAVLALAAALASLWEGHPGRWLALTASGLSLVVVATYFVYFHQANTSFATASIGTDAVAGELARWRAWHWTRTGLSMVAFAAALLSLRSR